MNLSQLTAAQVPYLSHSQIVDLCYQAVLSMLPDNCLTYSYHHESRGFKPFADREQVLSFTWWSVWNTFIVHRLPAMSHKGLCGSRLPGRQWQMMLGPLTGHVTLLAYDEDKDYAEARLWLMSFVAGWIDPYFWQSDKNYKAPKDLHSSRFSFVPENHYQSVTSKTTFIPSDVETVTELPALATQNVTLSDSQLCPCGCGVTLIGRQKSATPACRKRLERQRKVAA